MYCILDTCIVIWIYVLCFSFMYCALDICILFYTYVLCFALMDHRKQEYVSPFSVDNLHARAKEITIHIHQKLIQFPLLRLFSFTLLKLEPIH